MRKRALLMCLVEIGWAVAAFGNPVLWGGLEPGAYDVGFRVLALVDPTRSYGKRLARPVQVSLWYPVTRNPARSVTSLPFGDYVALYMTPVPQGHKTESRTEAFERYRKEWFPKEPQSSVIRLLETPAFAQRGAPPAKGPFPLVIYAPGYGAIPLTHTPTAEYLASHGYVVALSPSQGDSPAGMTFDVAGQEQQIRDIEFTLGALRNRPTIDSSKIALIGFSFGGGAAVVAAMRNLDIRAVVSLDGTVAFDHTVDILRQATGYDPAKFRSPLLVLKAEGDPEEDLSIVRSLAVSDRVVIRFRGVEHHDFIASPIISSVVTGRVTPSGKRAYPLVVSTILRFLNEHMTTVDPALHSLITPTSADSAQPGDPTSEVLLPGIEAPRTQDLVSESMSSGNVDRLIAAQRAYERQAPGIPLLTPGALHMLGLKFLDQERNDKTIQLYEFFVEQYPQDFFALNLLGDLYRERNENAKATEYYRRSLFAKPGNGGALEGLRMIDAKPTADQVRDLVHLPAGVFTMGCVVGDSSCDPAELPRHQVHFSHDIWMTPTEITVQSYTAFAAATGYRTRAESTGRGRDWNSTTGEWEWVSGLTFRRPYADGTVADEKWPAVQVSWPDAEAYCRWSGGRLPTEAEWEYAARGGREGEKFPWGDAPVPQVNGRQFANGPDEQMHRLFPRWEIFDGYDDGFPRLAPVARFEPNPYGLYDIAGNAWEWVGDWYASDWYAKSPRETPRGPAIGTERVVRGGSWAYAPKQHRNSERGFAEPDFWTATFGFRCAYDSDPKHLQQR
jgi:formylglycine-generating enzyme